MPDSFTENSSQSIFGRIGNAIKGVLVGIVLIPISIVLLSWNEGRAVKTSASLKEGAAAAVSVSADAIQAANQGKLIHLSGEVTTADTLTDPMFMISRNAIRLSRMVAMFQWHETKEEKTHKKLGGGTETETTYTYSKKWSDEIIDSSDFKHPAGHENPSTMKVRGTREVADNVMMGAFKIPEKIISKMQGDQMLAMTGEEFRKLPPELKEKAKLAGEVLYLGSNPDAPAIGDLRVTFTQLKPAMFSVLARQDGNTLGSYQTKAGREIQRVEPGAVTAEIMFQHAQKENTIITWLLRLFGLILMTIGFAFLLNPISTFASVIPFLGDIVGMGTGFAALIAAAFCSTVVIAVAWFAVRPVLSIVLVATAIGAVIFFKRMGPRKKPAAK